MIFSCMKRADEDAKRSRLIEAQLREWNTFGKAVKLLLLGTGEAGKTTIVKQMKILHVSGFNDSERTSKIKEIYQNIHESIYTIVCHMDKLDPKLSFDTNEHTSSAQYIIQFGESGPINFDQEYFDHVAMLWDDNGVKECYKRSYEYQLIDSAKYFLDRLDMVQKQDYVPSDQDILQCRQKTTEIQKVEFSVAVPKKYGGGSQEFWMFDVGGQRGYRKKWFQVFEGIEVILFLVASSEFDQKLRENNTVNRLSESLSLFEEIWNSRFLRSSGIIMFLNKQDVLKSKVESGKNIGDYFPDYSKYSLKDGHANDEYTRTKCYIRDLFKAITRQRRMTSREQNFVALPGLSVQIQDQEREFYQHFTIATDTRNIKTVFEDVHTMVIMWNINNSVLL